MISRWIVNVIINSSVNIWMADRIADIMADKACQKGDSLFTLLLIWELGKLCQKAAKKIIYMVFMHIRTHIAVVTVAQDRNVVEKHIRSLKAKLVEPAVFGYNIF